MRVKIAKTLRSLRKQQKALEEAADRAAEKTAQRFVREARKLTPRDSGKARSGWRVERRNGRPVVVNNTPYIGRLDKGGYGLGPKTRRPAGGFGLKAHVSKQAPRGITGPAREATEKKAKREIEREFRRAVR